MKTINTKVLAFVGVLSLLSSFAGFASANTYPINPNPSCVALSRGLFLGARDDIYGKEVTQLQTFLAEQGYFSVAATGYFGPVTFSAVKNFQRDHNISAIGLVGPLTRAEMERVSCGSTSNTLNLNSLSPTSGVIGTSVTVTGSGFTNDNLVTFGGGAAGRFASSNGGTSLTFTVPSALNPRCFYSTPRCLTFAASMLTTPGNYDVSVVNANGESNKLTFTVTNTSTSAPHINYISPTSGQVNASVTIYGTGFNSSDTVSFGGTNIGTFNSSNGGITFTIPQYLTPFCPPNAMCPMYMRLVTPGNYDVVVSNTNGASNSAQFTVTSASSNSVSISGLDAPTQLRVGQSGTWTVHASDSSGSVNLSYSVVWGDESYNYPYAMNASSGAVSQTSTFTHTYNTVGTFSPKFTVTNSSGVSANTSASVLVTN